MTANAWLDTEHQLAPGTEVFRSEREFALWAYSGGRLLLRSAPYDGHATTIDLLFTEVTAVRLRDRHDGLAVRTATAEEAERAGEPAGSRVFLLESRNGTGHVAGAAVGWEEGVLDRTRPSFFSDADPYEPQWPTRPLTGADRGGFTVASAADLIAALGAGDDVRPHRERYRMVYVLMTGRRPRGDDDPIGTGVFLSRADAEEACAAIAPQVADCWVETLPIAI